MEVHFCRRCGSSVIKENEVSYICQNGHVLFYDAAPAASSILVTPEGRMVLSIRATDPHKGKTSLFGGFVAHSATFEEALERELQEEVGLAPDDYEEPIYLISATDDYPWQGNVTQVISAMYLVRLKPQAKLVPADDVADVRYVDPYNIPYADVAFAGNIVGIKKAVEAWKDLTEKQAE